MAALQHSRAKYDRPKSSAVQNPSPPTHVRLVKVLRRPAAAHAPAKTVAVAAVLRAHGAARLLRRVDLAAQVGRALVDDLQLREVRVEDADDLGDLYFY